jgi:hypothetical protein
MNAETTSPQRVSSLFSLETLMAFFGDKFFLADRCTQNRERSKRLRRRAGQLIGNGMVGILLLQRCEKFAVGREHGDGRGMIAGPVEEGLGVRNLATFKGTSEGPIADAGHREVGKRGSISAGICRSIINISIF